MISFLRTYRHILIGLVLAILLVYLLERFKWILIDKNEILSNTLGFVFFWSFLALIIYKIPDFKSNKSIALKVIGLFLFIVFIVIMDNYMKTPDNPLTITLLVMFGFFTIYFLAPKIVSQYKFFLILYYAITLGYFLYRRIIINDLVIYYQQQKELFILLMLPFFILLYLWAYKQWKGFNTLKIAKGKAELDLLKSQINPHFLFNTLNNLYGLTVEKSEEAPDVVLKLSDMLRYTIYEGKEDLVFLKNEITYLENYIGLHKIRHQKKIDILFNHTILKDTKIAPLLFIILVENAFKHGAERLTDDAFIHINLTNQENYVRFEIENNFEASEFNTKKGIGLDNLMQRLKLIYPDKHSFYIENNLSTYKAVLEIQTK